MPIVLTRKGKEKVMQAIKIMRRLELEYAEEIGAKLIHFDGPCAFLLCLERGEHDHAICPDCGSAKFGNVGCATCKELHLRQTAALGGDIIMKLPD